MRVRDQADRADERLEAVLEAFAFISHEHHGSELAAFLHRGEHVARARQHLSNLIRDLLAEGAKSGQLRDDVPPGELASYCLHALGAASDLPSKAAVRRLVAVTLAGVVAKRRRKRATKRQGLVDMEDAEIETMRPAPHGHVGGLRTEQREHGVPRVKGQAVGHVGKRRRGI